MRKIMTWLSMLSFELFMLLAPGAAHAFTGTLTQAGGWRVGANSGLFTPSGMAKFANGVAKTSTIANIAGRAVQVEIALAAAESAATVLMASAMLASPLIVGAGVVAYMNLGKIHPGKDPATGADVWRHDVHHDGKSLCVGNQCAGPGDKMGACAMYGIAYNMTHVGSEIVAAVSPYDACGIYPDQAHAGGTSYLFQVQFSEGSNGYDQPDPVTPADTAALAAAYPVDTAAKDSATQKTYDDFLNAEGHLPSYDPPEVPVKAPTMDPQFVPESLPYTDPLTGDTMEDGVMVDDVPGTADPTDVTATPTTKDVTKGNYGDTSGDSTSSLCDDYPDILACQKMGEDPGEEVARNTRTVTYSQEFLGLPAACPAPISVNGQQISYQTACDAMLKLAPFVRALGAVGAMLMIVAVVRRD